MHIALGTDHGGFCQKAEIAQYVEELGHTVEDMGCDSEQSVDYPDYADRVARLVSEGKADRGILICGTGLGMALTADKVDGVRAVPINDVVFAELCRRHNNANVICLSGRFVGIEMNKLIVKTFLETEFEGGRHAIRVGKMMSEDTGTFDAGAPAVDDK